MRRTWLQGKIHGNHFFLLSVPAAPTSPHYSALLVGQLRCSLKWLASRQTHSLHWASWVATLTEIIMNVPIRCWLCQPNHSPPRPQAHRQAASGMLLFCFCFLFVFVFVFSGMRSGCWSKCKNCLVRRDLSGGVMNRRWERNNLGLESTFRARLAAI